MSFIRKLSQTRWNSIGLATYGKWDPTTDTRDIPHEFDCEISDVPNYVYMMRTMFGEHPNWDMINNLMDIAHVLKENALKDLSQVEES